MLGLIILTHPLAAISQLVCVQAGQTPDSLRPKSDFLRRTGSAQSHVKPGQEAGVQGLPPHSKNARFQPRRGAVQPTSGKHKNVGTAPAFDASRCAPGLSRHTEASSDLKICFY